ncbi:MAG TPA: thiamine-phosphate kinase [Pyrinomonadaceae bacterium]|nr:thiamine-phosphate kinase [Pyrinomonadaceae bacterium]
MSTFPHMSSEFDFIYHLRSKYAVPRIGDDCAVLPKNDATDLLLTADMLIEDIDFRLDWTEPEYLGHKSLAVSLSDIAAMGGKPVWAMVSIGVPASLWETDFLDRFYTGWFDLARTFGVELVGGDISRSPERLFIDSIAGGEVPSGKSLMRSGAKAGDAVFVTGRLGAAAGGLKLLERGFIIDPELPDLTRDLLSKQLQPQPQVMLANRLQTLGIVASMIDVSDGLSSDLRHLCDQSGTGASIFAERIPVSTELGSFFHSDDCREMALHGGEDFELLFTIDESNATALDSLPVTRIGEMTADAGSILLISAGQRKILEPRGYQHFL